MTVIKPEQFTGMVEEDAPHRLFWGTHEFRGNYGWEKESLLLSEFQCDRSKFTPVNLISSLTINGSHAPALDIDFPAKLEDGRLTLYARVDWQHCGDLMKILATAPTSGEDIRFNADVRSDDISLIIPGARLVPSATPEHFHLYIDTEMGWESYARLLAVLGEAGILGEGFVKSSLWHGMSFLRYPADAKKHDPPVDDSDLSARSRRRRPPWAVELAGSDA